MSWSNLRPSDCDELDLSKNISSNLKLLRDQIGISQKELCNVFSIAQQTYNGYERGRHEPPLTFLVELSRFYRVPLDALLGLGANGSETDRLLIIASEIDKEYINELSIAVYEAREFEKENAAT